MSEINEELFDKLKNSPVEEEVMKTVNDYTRRCMFVLGHIPLKYFLPGAGEEFSKLAKEIGEFGDIRLDNKGKPCVLSGEPPVVPRG